MRLPVRKHATGNPYLDVPFMEQIRRASDPKNPANIRRAEEDRKLYAHTKILKNIAIDFSTTKIEEIKLKHIDVARDAIEESKKALFELNRATGSEPERREALLRYMRQPSLCSS